MHKSLALRSRVLHVAVHMQIVFVLSMNASKAAALKRHLLNTGAGSVGDLMWCNCGDLRWTTIAESDGAERATAYKVFTIIDPVSAAACRMGPRTFLT